MKLWKAILWLNDSEIFSYLLLLLTMSTLYVCFLVSYKIAFAMVAVFIAWFHLGEWAKRQADKESNREL